MSFDNRAPQLITPIKNQQLIINQIVFINLPFTDQDGDTLTLLLISQIPFLDLSSDTERITAIPKAGNQGSYQVNVLASDEIALLSSILMLMIQSTINGCSSLVF